MLGRLGRQTPSLSKATVEEAARMWALMEDSGILAQEVTLSPRCRFLTTIVAVAIIFQAI